MGKEFKVKVRVEGDSAGAVSAVQKTDTSVKKLATTVRQNFLKITAILGTAAIAFREVQAATNLDSQTRALRVNLAQQGQDFDEFIAKLREVSDAQVATANLVQSSGRALLLGIPAAKIADLLEVARASAIATGDSITKSFDDILTGIGRTSPLILDNLGIVVDITKANKDYASSLGLTVSELTEQQKQIALTNAVLETSEGRVNSLTDEQNRLATIIAQVTAKFADWRRSLADIVLLLPDAVAGASLLREELEKNTISQENLNRQTELGEKIQQAVVDTLASGVTGYLTLTQALADLKRENDALNQVQKKSLDLQNQILERLAEQEKGTGSLLDLTVGYASTVRDATISNIDFSLSFNEIIQQFAAERRAAGDTDEAIKSQVKNFTTMTKAVGSAAEAYRILIKNQERSNRIASESGEALITFREEAERLGIVLESEVTAEIEKNNKVLETAEFLFGRGEITAQSYANTLKTVTDENVRLTESLTGVTEEGRTTNEVIDEMGRSAEDAGRRIDGLASSQGRLRDATRSVNQERGGITSPAFSSLPPLITGGGPKGGTFTVVNKTIKQLPNGRIIVT